MPDLISHAEMIAAINQRIEYLDDVIRSGYELAAGERDAMRAVLVHLERTQPTDTQADLTERARAVWHRIADGNMAYAVTIILAALQSEREAAAVEARRARRPKTLDELKRRIWSDAEESAYQAALEECARIARNYCGNENSASTRIAESIESLASPPEEIDAIPKEVLIRASAIASSTTAAIRRFIASRADSMPSKRMVLEQQLSDAGEDLVRLAAAKDAEIAALIKERDGYKRDYEDTRDCLNNERRIWTRINAGGATFAAERDEARAEITTLTEQRARAVKVARALYKWAPRPWIAGANVTWPEWDAAYDEAEALFAALDAEAVAESSPSLPETP